MRTVRRGFVVAIALSTVVFTSTAMAGKGGVKGSNSAAPRVRLAPARVRLAHLGARVRFLSRRKTIY
jgi:hypothetical protein